MAYVVHCAKAVQHIYYYVVLYYHTMQRILIFLELYMQSVLIVLNI